MTPRRKPIFVRSRRSSAQPHWLWVVVSLGVLVAVTLFDVGPAHHSWATSTPEQVPAQLQASN